VANTDSTTAFILTEQGLYSRLSGIWRSGSAPVAELFSIVNDVLDRRLKMAHKVVEKQSQISSGLSTREMRTVGIVFDDLVEICESVQVPFCSRPFTECTIVRRTHILNQQSMQLSPR
jgi:hypothetical protein